MNGFVEVKLVHVEVEEKDVEQFQRLEPRIYLVVIVLSEINHQSVGYGGKGPQQDDACHEEELLHYQHSREELLHYYVVQKLLLLLDAPDVAFLEGEVFFGLVLDYVLNKVNLEVVLFVLLLEFDVQLLRKLLRLHVLRQSHALVHLCHGLVGPVNFVEKHSHQVIFLTSVEPQFQHHLETIPRTLSQLQTLLNGHLPVLSTHCFLPHVHRDSSLLVCSVKKQHTAKELAVHVDSLFLLNIEELLGNVGVEVVDDGVHVLEDVELLELEVLVREKLPHFLGEVQDLSSLGTEDYHILLLDLSETHQIDLFLTVVDSWPNEHGHFLHEVVLVFQQDILRSVEELFSSIIDEVEDVRLVLGNVVVWDEDVDVLFDEFVRPVSENQLLVGLAAVDLDIPFQVYSQFQGEVVLVSTDVLEIPLGLLLELQFQLLSSIHANDEVVEEMLVDEVNEGVRFQLGEDLEVLRLRLSYHLVEDLDFFQLDCVLLAELEDLFLGGNVLLDDLEVFLRVFFVEEVLLGYFGVILTLGNLLGNAVEQGVVLEPPLFLAFEDVEGQFLAKDSLFIVQKAVLLHNTVRPDRGVQGFEVHFFESFQ